MPVRAATRYSPTPGRDAGDRVLLTLYVFALLALMATAVLTAYLLPPDDDL